MTSQEAKRLVETEPDFVAIKRFEYSLNKLMMKYPEGAPTKVIAQALLVTEDEVEELYEGIIMKLRQALDVSVA